MFVNQADWLTLAWRLGLAMLVGGAIGWNRQKAGKPAGLRTHILVAMGSCVLVLVPLAGEPASVEALSRVIQGVIVGIGFLGGGEIRHSGEMTGRNRIKGLTSAAAIWVSSGLGIAAACGLWRMIILAAVAAILVLAVAKKAEHRLFAPAEEQEEVP
ncbi:MAG TPA: MgtC/SapB family protein [Polyangia bacterium]|jgi:putative Mg2+ transporter-C (MgtC) family protein|nr:MgtC/SapB family protein [Polyangia bacterium]